MNPESLGLRFVKTLHVWHGLSTLFHSTMCVYLAKSTDKNHRKLWRKIKMRIFSSKWANDYFEKNGKNSVFLS